MPNRISDVLYRILAVLGLATLIAVGFIPMNDAVHPILKRVLCVTSAVLFALSIAIYVHHRRRLEDSENSD